MCLSWCQTTQTGSCEMWQVKRVTAESAVEWFLCVNWVLRLTRLQVSVMLCTAQTLFGPLQDRVLEESWGLSARRVRVNVHLWWRDLLLLCFLVGVSTFLRVLCLHLIRLRPQGRLHDDGGHLSEVLSAGWLSGHDGLGTVHPGRGLTVQIPAALLPASQLSEMFLLDVSLGHRQLYDLKHRDRMNMNQELLSIPARHRLNLFISLSPQPQKGKVEEILHLETQLSVQQQSNKTDKHRLQHRLVSITVPHALWISLACTVDV